MKKVEELVNIFIRDNHLIAAQLEMEALSYPILGKIGEILVERFFIMSNQPQTIKGRPYAWFVIHADTGKMLEYSNCAINDFAKSLNISLDETLDYSLPDILTYKEIKSTGREYSDIYNEIRKFAFTNDLSEEQKNLISLFKKIQNKLINKDVLPFYQQLSPEFYTWIDNF